jgi:hypothetical protein
VTDKVFPSHRCARCSSMLVDLQNDDGSIDRVCASCDGPLECFDIVRQLHRRKPS